MMLVKQWLPYVQVIMLFTFAGWLRGYYQGASDVSEDKLL